MEEQKRRLEKTDKELREQNFTKTRIAKADIKLFGEYCKRQHISKLDALHKLIHFLHETNMPISGLHIQNVTQLVRNYHNYTAGVLKNFENSFLDKLDKNQTDNTKFITNIMELILKFKSIDSVINAQNFKLLRGLVQATMDEEDANSLLKETLLEVREAEQKALLNTDRNDQKETFILEGVIKGKIPKISTSAKGDALYLLFTLAQSPGTNAKVIWHKVIMWEGPLTQALKLPDKTGIRNYFATFKMEDTLKLKGFTMESKYKDGEDKVFFETTFVVTEVISHTNLT
jgi:NAD-dependent DNA ligase